MRILYAVSFLRAYRKLSVLHKEKVDIALSLFQSNPFDPKLRNHKLSGPKRDARSFSAGYDMRIVYQEKDGHLVVLMLNVGTHDEVY